MFSTICEQLLKIKSDYRLWSPLSEGGGGQAMECSIRGRGQVMDRSIRGVQAMECSIRGAGFGVLYQGEGGRLWSALSGGGG